MSKHFFLFHCMSYPETTLIPPVEAGSWIKDMSAPLREDPVPQNALTVSLMIGGGLLRDEVVQGEFGKLKDNLSCVFWRMMSCYKWTSSYIAPFYPTPALWALYTPCVRLYCFISNIHTQANSSGVRISLRLKCTFHTEKLPRAKHCLSLIFHSVIISKNACF